MTRAWAACDITGINDAVSQIKYSLAELVSLEIGAIYLQLIFAVEKKKLTFDSFLLFYLLMFNVIYI